MSNYSRAIHVVPYNSEWPTLFQAEARAIKNALDANAIAIHHVGSTAIPGLWAKPKIDILGVVKDPSTTLEALEKVGFQYKGEYNIPLHYGFSKRDAVDVNLHVYEEGHPEIELNLLFRDCLIKNPELRDAYTRLKQMLLKDPSVFEKSSFGFTRYTLKKGNFIRDVLKKADFKRLRILKCSDETEWAVAKALRQKYCVQSPIVESSEHIHLVLYEGVAIVGYAHIEFAPDLSAATCSILMDLADENNQLIPEFSALCEKWLKHLGAKNITVPK